MWFNKDKKAKKQQREAVLKAAMESSEALEKAAKGTMNLAEDVTKTLQSRIDDYAQQIDQTARLLSDALMLVDDHGIIESFNQAAESMFGHARRSIRGKNLSTLFEFQQDTKITPDFMEELMNKVSENDLSATVHYEDFMGVRKDDTKFYVDVGVSKIIRSNSKVKYIILVRDVSQKVMNSKMLEELAQRNQELLATIDASNTGFIIISPDGSDFKINFVNEGFSRLTGYSRTQIRNMSLMDLLGIEQTFWSVRRSLLEHVEARHEVQLEIGNCQTIWFDVQITPVFQNGVLNQWILVFYDTTALKKAYHDLRKSESHFKAFSDASSESMLIHNFGQVIDWNDRLNKLTGYSDEEIEQLGPLDLVHPLEREKIRDEVHLLGSNSYETLFMTKQGDVREVAVNSRSIEWENADARIAIVRDVTEYKDIETQLKTARERYRTVIDNTIDMVICFNANFEITFSNQTFRDYYDVELEDINGFSLLEIIPEPDHRKFMEYMLSITPDMQVRRGIHRVQRHDEVRMQDWIDRGIFDEDGTLIEIQSIARDVTSLLPPPNQT
jgi:PAS domain S-box-containing protein